MRREFSPISIRKHGEIVKESEVKLDSVKELANLLSEEKENYRQSLEKYLENFSLETFDRGNFNMHFLEDGFDGGDSDDIKKMSSFIKLGFRKEILDFFSNLIDNLDDREVSRFFEVFSFHFGGLYFDILKNFKGKININKQLFFLKNIKDSIDIEKTFGDNLFYPENEKLDIRDLEREVEMYDELDLPQRKNEALRRMLDLMNEKIEKTTLEDIYFLYNNEDFQVGAGILLDKKIESVDNEDFWDYKKLRTLLKMGKGEFVLAKLKKLEDFYNPEFFSLVILLEEQGFVDESFQSEMKEVFENFLLGLPEVMENKDTVYFSEYSVMLVYYTRSGQGLRILDSLEDYYSHLSEEDIIKNNFGDIVKKIFKILNVSIDNSLKERLKNFSDKYIRPEVEKVCNNFDPNVRGSRDMVFFSYKLKDMLSFGYFEEVLQFVKEGLANCKPEEFYFWQKMFDYVFKSKEADAAITDKNKFEKVMESLNKMFKIILSKVPDKSVVGEALKKTSDIEKSKFVDSIFFALSEEEKESLSNKKIKEVLEENFDKISHVERQFLFLIIKKYGISSREVLSILEKISTGEKFVGDIDKTGGELHIVSFGKKDHVKTQDGQELNYSPVVFLNTLEKKNYEAWRDLGKNLPISPIVGDVWKKKDGKYVVPTRYCGPDVGFLTGIQIDREQNNWYRDFSQFLEMQSKILINKLNALGFKHGHGHPGNATVEWVREGYYQEQMKKHGNVNEIPFDPDNFSFDLSDFVKDPEEWHMVARVIDFDFAESI